MESWLVTCCVIGGLGVEQLVQPGGGRESLYDVTFVWKDEWDIAGKVYTGGKMVLQ